MAKLAGLFGRKGNETDAGTTAPKPANGKTAVAIVSIENFSDVGSRTGEENEVLRSLLTDTGRNIGELYELKQGFNKQVRLFNSTLRALEHEKSQMSLDYGPPALYTSAMHKWIVFTPLFALLAAAIWFAASSWVHFAGATIPVYGWLAIAGGVVFSLLVGGGLMALLFYSHRHGYDDLGGDGPR